jgi:hypothetical protein
MGLVIAFAVLAVILFGLGFAIKWLFILAVLALLVSVVLGFTGRTRSGGI